MFHGDRNWAFVAVAVLWTLYGFVFYEVKDLTGSQAATVVLGVFGALVLLFNSASILAMIYHLNEEREEIYGLDIHYLDARKQ
ncbi:MAG: hypothetical protein JSR78_17145 [Proteobacteria bacterium]|nr:hypothetical protein [Pseudomonadota bacterium]